MIRSFFSFFFVFAVSLPTLATESFKPLSRDLLIRVKIYNLKAPETEKSREARRTGQEVFYTERDKKSYKISFYFQDSQKQHKTYRKLGTATRQLAPEETFIWSSEQQYVRSYNFSGDEINGLMRNQKYKDPKLCMALIEKSGQFRKIETKIAVECFSRNDYENITDFKCPLMDETCHPLKMATVNGVNGSSFGYALSVTDFPQVSFGEKSP